MILDAFLDSVHRTVLPNGLTLLVREDPSADVVAIETWVKAGYFHEPDEVAGMAHLFEHMFFKGSKNFPGAEEIARHISHLGGVTNAGTIYDSTSYYVVVPSRGFEKAVEIQADAILHPLFDPDEIRREAEVVIEESNRKLDNPAAVAIERMYATAFTRHRMKRWRIGSNEVLRSIDRDHLIEFFGSLYRPANIIVSIVGDVSVEKAVSVVEKTFGRLPTGRMSKERGPEEPPQDGFRFGSSSADISQSYSVFGWHTPGERHEDDQALDLLASILASGRYSRLYRRVVGPRGASSASAWNSVYEDAGIFNVMASYDPANGDQVESSSLREIEGMRRDGPNAFELQLAKNRIESRFLFSIEEVLGQAETLAYYESRGGYRDAGSHLERLLRVTEEEVRDVARRYLRFENMTLFRHRPHGESEGHATVERKLSAVIDEGYGGENESVPAMPESGRIVARSKSLKPVQRFVLSNGITLFVRENPASPTVSLMLGFRGGRIHEHSANAGVTELMCRAMKRGTATRDAEQIDREIEFLGTQIGVVVEEDYFGLGADVPQKHLRAAMSILADVVLHPSFPDDQIARERHLQNAAIRRALDSSGVRPFQLFREAFYGSHPYGLPDHGHLASVEGLSNEAIRAWFESTVVADDAIIVVAGDVDVADLVELMEEELGMVPKRERLQRAPVAFQPGPPRAIIERRDRKQTAIVAGVPAVPPQHPDWIALRLLQDVTSGLAGTLFAELRGRRALCYTVLARASSHALAGAFVAYIATEATKEEEAAGALIEELQRLCEGGMTEDDLDRAKSYLAGTTKIRLQTNAANAAEIARNYLFGLGLDFTDRLLDSARLLTLDDVRRVARNYLSRDNYTVATLRGSVGGSDG